MEFFLKGHGNSFGESWNFNRSKVYEPGPWIGASIGVTKFCYQEKTSIAKKQGKILWSMPFNKSRTIYIFKLHFNEILQKVKEMWRSGNTADSHC